MDMDIPDLEDYDNRVESVERLKSECERNAITNRGRSSYFKVRRDVFIPAVQREESACLALLASHSPEPRVLSDTDLTEGDDVRSAVSGSHRSKVSCQSVPYSLLVARSVPRNEFMGNKEAMDAYWKEWRNLEKKNTWRMETLAEWSDVVSKAKAEPHDVWKDEVHFGYLFGTMVQKGAEFKDGDSRKYYLDPTTKGALDG